MQVVLQAVVQIHGFHGRAAALVCLLMLARGLAFDVSKGDGMSSPATERPV